MKAEDIATLINLISRMSSEQWAAFMREVKQRYSIDERLENHE